MPLFALDVQRGGIPGQPGAYLSESLTLTSKQFYGAIEDYKSSKHRGPQDSGCNLAVKSIMTRVEISNHLQS